MLKLYIIILTVLISFSFSSVTLKTSYDNGWFRLSSGELAHLIGDPESSVRSYLKTLRDQSGYENAHRFPMNFHKVGKNSTQHFSFQQTYNTIPVFGRYIRVHIHGEVITSISSNIDNIELNVVPTITEFGAMNIIRNDNISSSAYLKYKKLQIPLKKG